MTSSMIGKHYFLTFKTAEKFYNRARRQGQVIPPIENMGDTCQNLPWVVIVKSVKTR